MPDQPPAKRSPHIAPLALGPRAGPNYAELHAKTNFSFLEGASHPDELVARAAALGYRALAVTDRHSLAGVVRAHVAAKEVGLKLLIGAEIRPAGAAGAVLLATDRAAYGRLSRLLTVGRRRAPKGECQLTFDDVAGHAAGLLACVLCDDLASLGDYRAAFGDRCYLLAELHRGPDDQRKLAVLLELARRAQVPLVAANDVRYHIRQRRALEDVLTAIRAGTTVAGAGELLAANAERHLKAPDEMAALFAAAPACIRRTVEVAGRCGFSLDELRYEYPEELCPAGMEAIEYLTRLTWQEAAKRYPAGIPDRVRALVEHELRLIAELRYEAYFLTVWDLVRFARSRGILCQGRGSAANSAVCYCLGVTSVDPDQIDVLFERFVSRERNEAPDIDVDFEHERREEVIQYIYDKYGRDRAGLTAEVITYRPRSAVRDVGKALGFRLDQLDALAKLVDPRAGDAQLAERLAEAGFDAATADVRRLIALTNELLGFPRHLSQHVGGMVITRGPLSELTPIENAAMPDRTVIQWDKNDLDELGILKVDCLALGMLTAIRKCFDLVERHKGQRLSLARVPQEDPAVYEMISRADTLGVFQIESRAQMSMLPRLRPRTFYDLVIEVAIVRPGPIQGNMVHPYLRRRGGQDPIEYPDDEIRQVLRKTLGVPIFQEQAMRLAVVAAGFTPGEADQLRRAMGAWRRPGVIESFRRKLLAGMARRGLPEEYAHRVFEQIRGFGEYGFPESHAASFALLVYVSAWLKFYHPAAFTAALLNSQPMGFYAPAQLVRDARRHGVEVRPVDVNASEWDCTLEERGQVTGDRLQDVAEFARIRGSEEAQRPELLRVQLLPTSDLAPAFNPQSAIRDPQSSLRLGFRELSGFSASHAVAIVAARHAGRFRSLDDFARRTGLGRAAIERLAKADAFASLALNRRAALWQALAEHREEPLPLFAGLESSGPDERPAGLPAMPEHEEVLADYRTAGLSLKGHPLTFLRPRLDELKVARAAELAATPHGRWLRVAGLVLVRQRPSSARGITFVTLEDETGVANLIVRQAIWERYHRVASSAVALVAHGRLERQGQVIHVLVSRLEDLAALAGKVESQSRDFR
ncbi:MAG TPA: error-prone DNA polymerase [Pirellulales bacterium]|nr:error-prone DNA polymerase [Pirellulales bacterium]